MKKVLIAVILLGVLAGGAWFGRGAYKRWKGEKLLRAAEEFMERRDLRGALLNVQEVVRSNPFNVRACRLMAEIAEILRSPNAMQWRSRVAELEPGVLKHHLAWANTAMVFGDLAAADKALSGVGTNGQNTAAFHQVVAALAIAANRLPDAAAHFHEAAKLDPTNPVPRMNLAILQLQSGNSNAVTAARETLETLRANPAVRTDVLRQLTFDSMRLRQFDHALALAREMEAQTNLPFTDRFIQLELLRATTNNLFAPQLKTVQDDAVRAPDSAFQMARWMMTHVDPRATLGWIEGLPATLRTNPPLPLISAECLAAQKRWSDLDAALGKAHWGDLDFFRFAHLTRSAKEQAQTAVARSHWLQALNGAGKSLERLSYLSRAATTWGWNLELEEVLWVVVNSFPRENWAFQALSARLHAKGNTRGLHQLYLKGHEIFPTNLLVKNNLAMTSMLLNGADPKPHELAKELYSADPGNAYFVSTYAYSLLVQKRYGEAVAAFEKLKDEQLQMPPIAAFYSLALTSAGDKDKARRYLKFAERATLLPEERALVERARL